MNEAFERDWRSNGKCVDKDPEMWFSASGKRVNEAKRLCNLCCVRRECLVFAVDAGIPYGVWGGLSEAERRAMPAGPRRRRPLTALSR